MGENIGHEYNGQKTTKKNLIQKYTEKLQSSKENKNNPIQKKGRLKQVLHFYTRHIYMFIAIFL